MPLLEPEAVSAGAKRDAPYESEARQPPTAHLPDLEHPWLGLESFRQETRAYFFGRDAEIGELHLRLRSHPLLVLYGRSGLGKTSILTAGLIPRLVAENKRPVLVRLRYDDPTLDPAGQLVAAIFGWGERQEGLVRLKSHPTNSLPWAQRLGQKLGLSMPEDYPSRLWLRLHYRGEPPDITHLILDQFEEVFTIGGQVPAADDNVRDAMSIILQGAIPKPITRLMTEHDTFLDEFDPDSVPVRVILALRDDYVYALNRWRRHLPALGQNNFELRALTGPAAFDAVFKPGELRCHYRGEIKDENRIETDLPPIIDRDTAARIVRFVAKRAPDRSMEDIEAVPPILSLLCRELNERRFLPPTGTSAAPTGKVTFRESDDDIETIIAAFYERCLGGRPEAVRIFIEQDLVSYSGARLAQDEESILRVFEHGCEMPGAGDEARAVGFGESQAARACLDELVAQRLLSPLGEKRYELIHDLLAVVVEKSRIARTERLHKEDADRRARQEHRAKVAAEKQARRARGQFLAAIAALIFAIFAGAAGWRQYQRAQIARDDAEKLIEFMTTDLRDKLEPVGRLNLLDDVSLRVQAYYDSFAGEEGSPEILRRRSVMLDNRGDVLSVQGDLTRALKSYRDSLAIREKLVRQDSSNPEWQRDLAASYDHVGDVLSEQGDLTHALESYRGSLAIREKLVGQASGNAEWQRDLAASYDHAGDVLSAQGDLTRALKSYRDGLTIRERLVGQDSGNAEWQVDLTASYDHVGDVLRDQGDLAGGLKSYRDSLAIREKLVRQDSGNAAWQRALSLSYINLGDVLRDQGDLAGGLKSYRDSLAIREKLAKQDPGNARWQRDLSISYDGIGNVQREQRDLAGALTSHRDSLAIAQNLAKQDSGNAVWQRDLSLSYTYVAGVLSAQGDLAGALKTYRDGLAIAVKLAKQDPGNAVWQRDLSLGHTNVGEVLRAQGDLAGALRSYRESFDNSEKLAKRDPGNGEWQSDLAFFSWRMGTTLARAEPKSNSEARAMVERARNILQQLKARAGLSASEQAWLDAIETDLRHWR